MNEFTKTEGKALEQVKVFENPLFGKVRTLLIDNNPYFVGKDIALALGYKDTADAIKTHVDEDDKKHFKVGEIPTLKTSNYGTILINESGVYAMVFGSKLSEAKKFKHWVTNEVLPSIRKNDIYATDAEYSNCGYFEIKQEVLDNGVVIYHRKITQLGRKFIINLRKNNMKKHKRLSA